MTTVERAARAEIARLRYAAERRAARGEVRLFAGPRDVARALDTVTRDSVRPRRPIYIRAGFHPDSRPSRLDMLQDCVWDALQTIDAALFAIIDDPRGCALEALAWFLRAYPRGRRWIDRILWGPRLSPRLRLAAIAFFAVLGGSIALRQIVHLLARSFAR